MLDPRQIFRDMHEAVDSLGTVDRPVSLSPSEITYWSC